MYRVWGLPEGDTPLLKPTDPRWKEGRKRERERLEGETQKTSAARMRAEGGLDLSLCVEEERAREREREPFWLKSSARFSLSEGEGGLSNGPLGLGRVSP